MTNVKNNEQFIPFKNYVLAIVIVVVIVLLTWYGFAWYRVFQENKVSTSYLVKEKVVSNEMNSLDEVEAVLSESPATFFLYISYAGSEDVYNMEKGLKNIINDYNLNDVMYYLNVTSIKEEAGYLDKINETLKLNDKKISNVPTIVYFRDGIAVDIIQREDNNIMNVGDFQKLLDVNKISKQ